jgi:hypothetical protein
MNCGISIDANKNISSRHGRKQNYRENMNKKY